jgi:hypothetical protein
MPMSPPRLQLFLLPLLLLLLILLLLVLLLHLPPPPPLPLHLPPSFLPRTHMLHKLQYLHQALPQLAEQNRAPTPPLRNQMQDQLRQN